MLSRQVPDFNSDYISRDIAGLLIVPWAATSCSVPHGSLLVSELSLEPGLLALSPVPPGPFPPALCRCGQQATALCPWAGPPGPLILAQSLSQILSDLPPSLSMTLSRPFTFSSIRFIFWNVCKMELVVLLTSQVCERLK